MTRSAGLMVAVGLAAILAAPHSWVRPAPVSEPATRSIRSAPLRQVAGQASRLDARSVWSMAKALASHAVSAPLGAIGSTGRNFDGLGDGFAGPAGTMTVTAAPPDPSGDVGPNHYVQAVNSQLAVFDKTGVALLGPVPLNTVWSGFGGDCEANNDGRATVLYDQMADRWVISQVSSTGADGTTRPYLGCVAVSTTGDPAGAYARYEFPYSVLPAAPTLAAWPDAYYAAFEVSGAAAGGSVVCAYERDQMLNGLPASQQCFGVDQGTLPADLDGNLVPPTGTAYLLSLGSNQASLTLRTLHVDWATPANSVLGTPLSLAVASWTEPTTPSVPQDGGGLLDPVAARLMRRLGFRLFGDGHAAIVANHTILAGTNTGTRWYEIAMRSLGTSVPVIAQQGTQAPDASHRWVGGLAMDHDGNIGLGYSVSSSSIKPELRYTGRLSGDPLGVMTQGEGTVIAGGGAQGAGLSAWGNYSSMTVDPADDCTFWFAGEYIPSDGTFNWRTRIATFTLPGCGAPANDFAIAANPNSLVITQNASAISTISTSLLSGSSESIALSVAGLPAGAAASFSPATVTTGDSAVLSLNAGPAAPGTYTVVVTGTSASDSHTATLSLTVEPQPDFSLSIAPSARTIQAGASTVYTVSSVMVIGAPQTIALSLSGLPAGVTGSFAPATIVAGGSSTLTVTAAAAATVGTTSFTVTGTAAAGLRQAAAGLTVTSSPGNSATPLANDVPVNALSGTAGSVKYFVLNVPPGQLSLTFTMSGGAGDADMYVRYGALPTVTTYNCRPYLVGNNETCSFNNPQAGDWFVMIRGYTTYSGASLKGTYTGAELTNGVPVTAISGSAGSQRLWKLTLPTGVSLLTVKIAGGTGDADLYVRFGSAPTTTSYFCRPYLVGNNETCTMQNPQAGDWYVMIRGYSAYSGVTLTATYTIDPVPVLSNGVPITGISGASGSQKFWKISVPAGRPNLTINISGGTGDADLYVRFGTKPTTTTYLCRPYLNGNNETCSVTNPQAGDWFVMLRAYTTFAGVTLKGQY